MVEMLQAAFETQLSQRFLRRRLIEGSVTVLFLALFIVCWSLREASKEVILHKGAYFIPGWEEVNYNDAYVPFIVLGVIGAIMASSLLLGDFLSCRYKTIEKGLHHITVYRGMLHNIVYVDGVEKGRIEPFSFTNVVETRLANQVKVTVCFNRSVWYIAHISFSDDSPSIEV